MNFTLCHPLWMPLEFILNLCWVGYLSEALWIAKRPMLQIRPPDGRERVSNLKHQGTEMGGQQGQLSRLGWAFQISRRWRSQPASSYSYWRKDSDGDLKSICKVYQRIFFFFIVCLLPTAKMYNYFPFYVSLATQGRKESDKPGLENCSVNCKLWEIG